jgi:hypothetical protein
MFCCATLALLFGQFGAFGAAFKAHVFGGNGPLQAALSAAVGGWSKARWLALSGALTVELVVAAAALPTLYALDVPVHGASFGNWPICAAVLKALAR